MRKLFSIFLLLFSVFLSVSALSPSSTLAHGVVGQRFFPATVAVDDPFVADEMDLLGYQTISNPDPTDPSHTQSQTYWSGISKRLTRDIGIQIKASYTMDHFEGQGNNNGFQNIVFGIMDQMIKIPAHEFIFSSALNVEIARTGNQSVAAPYSDLNNNGFQNIVFGIMDQMIKIPAHEFIFSSALNVEIARTGNQSVAAPYSTVSPEIYFGYGFGELPDSLRYLRPF